MTSFNCICILTIINILLTNPIINSMGYIKDFYLIKREFRVSFVILTYFFVSYGTNDGQD